MYSHKVCLNLLGTQLYLNTELAVEYLGESSGKLNLELSGRNER